MKTSMAMIRIGFCRILGKLFFGGWVSWYMHTSKDEFVDVIHMQNLFETKKKL
jgi:hypothetical protein